MTSKPTKNDWRVKSLRYTLFSVDIADKEHDSFWPTDDGISILSKREDKQAGEIVTEGLLGDDVKLVLISNPIKVDLFITTASDFLPRPPFVNTLGGSTEEITKYKELRNDWSTKVPNIKRVGFGGQFLNMVESRREGYGILSSLLPVSLDADIYSEFKMQLNRPVPSRVIDGVKINQLGNWSLGRLTGTLQGGTETEIKINTPEVFFCQSELDINTSQESVLDVGSSEILQLFSEIDSLLEEVVTKGLY